MDTRQERELMLKQKIDIKDVITEDNAFNYAALIKYGDNELLRMFSEPEYFNFHKSVDYYIDNAIAIYKMEADDWVCIWRGEEYE